MKSEVTFKKIPTKSVVQFIIDSITDALINQDLNPGDRLPTEPELAEQLGVGRNSVREAIKSLETLGVVEIRRAEGTFICQDISNRMLDPLVYSVILSRASSYEKVLELRELMETGIMRLAMKNGEPSQYKTLEHLLSILKDEIAKGRDNMDAIFDADNAFHDYIMTMADNEVIGKINEITRLITYKVRYDSVDEMMARGKGEELYQYHKLLLKILIEKNWDNLNEQIRKTYFFE